MTIDKQMIQEIFCVLIAFALAVLAFCNVLSTALANDSNFHDDAVVSTIQVMTEQ